MLNAMANLWHNMPLIIKLPLDFTFSVIFVRGILAKEIMDYLKEKGFFKQGLIHAILDNLKHYVPSAERHLTIWLHFKNRSLGLGHETEDILKCKDQDCAAL